MEATAKWCEGYIGFDDDDNESCSDAMSLQTPVLLPYPPSPHSSILHLILHAVGAQNQTNQPRCLPIR